MCRRIEKVASRCCPGVDRRVDAAHSGEIISAPGSDAGRRERGRCGGGGGELEVVGV